MITTDTEITDLVEAARLAGRQEIMPRFRRLEGSDIDSKSHADDLVTIADKAAEELISAAVAITMPDASIVGEESVAADPNVLDRLNTTERSVIIDPIDGTWNYANGLTTFGVIIAVIEEGQTVAGILYDPVMDDWIITKKASGTWYCRDGAAGKRLQMSTPISTASEAFGFLPINLFQGKERKNLAMLTADFKRTTSLRCSCHEYRTLVQNSADFSLNAMLNSWDHAAGVLAVQEAGGVAKLLDGQYYHAGLKEGRLLIAKSDALWNTLSEEINAVLSKRTGA